jgi:hypothetical protein
MTMTQREGRRICPTLTPTLDSRSIRSVIGRPRAALETPRSARAADGALLDGFRVRELEVRTGLLQVAHELLLDAPLPQDRLARAERLDRAASLREVLGLRCYATEAERDGRAECLHEDICYADSIECVAKLLLGRKLALSHRFVPSP